MYEYNQNRNNSIYFLEYWGFYFIGINCKLITFLDFEMHPYIEYQRKHHNSIFKQRGDLFIAKVPSILPYSWIYNPFHKILMEYRMLRWIRAHIVIMIINIFNQTNLIFIIVSNLIYNIIQSNLISYIIINDKMIIFIFSGNSLILTKFT